MRVLKYEIKKRNRIPKLAIDCTSRKACSNSFPKVTMKKIPLEKSAKRKKEKKDKGEENPSPHLNSTCFLSNFETRSWKVIFPPFFPATWHSESKSIWAKRTQCAKLLAYRAHGSFQFSPSFLLFLPTQSSNPPVESISNVPPPPPSLRLLSFFHPSKRDIDLSVIFGRDFMEILRTMAEQTRCQLRARERVRAGEEGQRVNVHAPPFPRIERLWWEDTLNKTGKGWVWRTKSMERDPSFYQFIQFQFWELNGKMRRYLWKINSFYTFFFFPNSNNKVFPNSQKKENHNYENKNCYSFLNEIIKVKKKLSKFFQKKKRKQTHWTPRTFFFPRVPIISRTFTPGRGVDSIRREAEKQRGDRAASPGRVPSATIADADR